MRYKSFADLSADLARWAPRLPSDIDIVVGIPRSGIPAAALLSLRLNLPLTDVAGLVAGRLMSSGARMAGASAGSGTSSHRDGPIRDDEATIAAARRILVLDDSIHSGTAMRLVREQLRGSEAEGRALYAAVYADPRAVTSVDRYCEVVAMPRIFEWNLFHHPMLASACVDIDGVLCRDPRADENDDGERYAAFLANADLLVRPTVEIGCLVTSRLERYRAPTETWLARHGIRYRTLVMHPATSASERRAAADHAKRKALVYARSRGELFIESELHQAYEIADRSGRPVYCVDAARLISPGDSVLAGASRRPASVVALARTHTRSMARSLHSQLPRRR